jgi:predicted amidohydrolase
VSASKLRIGYVQFRPLLGQPEANRERLAELIPRAVGVDLLVLPELANSGYNFTSQEQADDTAESAEDGPFVRFLIDTASKYDMYLVAGLNERDGEVRYNTSVLIGPDKVLGKYRKIHLFVNEPDFFAPGDIGLPVFDLGKCKVGMLICFDWLFPEVWRILALKGADVIAHPSNLVIPGFCQRVMPSHALINGLYTITANRIGSEGRLTFTGLSTIADPGGQVLAEGPQAAEDVRVVEIDLSLAREKTITPRNDRLADRRPELYQEIIE